MYSLLVRVVIICTLSAGLGISVNFLSPHGVPLFGPVPIKMIPGVDIIEGKGAWESFQGKEAVFIDARSEEEYEKGHVPGAMLVNVDNFDEKISAMTVVLPYDTMVITYCSGSGCESSLEVAGLLKDAGYLRINVFYGGWQLWKNSGYPIETGLPLETAGESIF